MNRFSIFSYLKDMFPIHDVMLLGSFSVILMTFGHIGMMIRYNAHPMTYFTSLGLIMIYYKLGKKHGLEFSIPLMEELFTRSITDKNTN